MSYETLDNTLTQNVSLILLLNIFRFLKTALLKHIPATSFNTTTILTILLMRYVSTQNKIVITINKNFNNFDFLFWQTLNDTASKKRKYFINNILYWGVQIFHNWHVTCQKRNIWLFCTKHYYCYIATHILYTLFDFIWLHEWRLYDNNMRSDEKKNCLFKGQEQYGRRRKIQNLYFPMKY